MAVGASYSAWAAWAKPTWVETLDATRYFAATVLLSLFTVLVSVFSVQPILYLLIKAN